MCAINEDHMRYGYSDVRLDRQSFCHVGPFFALDPPNNPKNQNFEKMKKKPREDIIILHVFQEL